MTRAWHQEGCGETYIIGRGDGGGSQAQGHYTQSAHVEALKSLSEEKEETGREARAGGSSSGSNDRPWAVSRQDPR